MILKIIYSVCSNFQFLIIRIYFMKKFRIFTCLIDGNDMVLVFYGSLKKGSIIILN